MLTVYRSSICIVLTSCLLAYGCRTAKDIGKTLGDLTAARAELIKKFGEEDVRLHANTFHQQTMISVTYVNSPLNQKSSEERVKRAQETAQIVKQQFPSLTDAGQIWVGFTHVTTHLGIFHWSETLESYGFDGEGRLLLGPGIAPPPDASQPEGRYSASQDKTEISSNVIQLEGTTEKGVMLFPHVSVPGDVRKATPKPPDEVALDFAAFSDKPKFPNVTKIVFLADNKIVYVTDGQFSTSKIAGEMYSEFLYLKIPTAAFLKLSSGNTIKIKLNEREYTLNESQRQQMQRMANYLR